MSRLNPLLFILVAALCFIAGYTVGKKNGVPTISDPAPAPQLLTAPVEDAVFMPEPAEPMAAEAAPETAAPVIMDDAPNASQLAQRAQQQFITLTDTKERSIQVEVLDTSETHLKVRRQSDLRIVQVPIQMLSDQDQTFAAYLWKEKKPTQRTKGTNEQMILEELFGGF